MRSNINSSINNTTVTFTDTQGNALYDFGGVVLPVHIEGASGCAPATWTRPEWFFGAVYFGAIRVEVDDTSCSPDFGERFDVEVTLGAEKARGNVDYVSTEPRDDWGRDPQAAASLPLPLVKRLAEAARAVLRAATREERVAAWADWDN